MNRPLGRSTADLQAQDARHHLHPFSEQRALAARGVRIITHADGVYLWDSEGNRILDGMAGLWNVNLGYGRHDLAQAAYDQLIELPYYNTFFQCTHPPAVELATALAEVAPEGMSRVFFASSGSEANDSIIKMVRYYWNLMGKPEKKTVIGRDYGYHGVTLGAASLSGIKPMHLQADLPLPQFAHIMAPYWYAHGGELAPEAFGLQAARALEAKILELGPDRVAAFIGEPVQGAGGVIVPPDSYWPEIQRICAKYDLLLIADEVICGFGRVGRWFGSERYGIRPDFMTLAKGLSSGYLPISAVLVHDRVGDVLYAAAQEWAHGFTYSGHPTACAVALANLRALVREGWLDYVANDIGPYFQSRLAELADHALVGEVRGVGLMAGLELVADKTARRHFPAERQAGILCRDHSIRCGLVMRAVRDIMILSPPLVISRSEVDELTEKARRALDLTARDLDIA